MINREQVRVNGFGLFLMFIFPGAYVDLHTDHLEDASSIRQLRYQFNYSKIYQLFLFLFLNRIFCAGVWHNVVLVIISLILLYLHPFIVYFLFIRSANVAQIVEVNYFSFLFCFLFKYFYFYCQSSPLNLILPINANIKSIGTCSVESRYTWYSCLNDLAKNTKSGYCLTADEILSLAISTSQF